MITFFAPMNYLGYGVHSYELMRALDYKGVDIALFTPFGNMGRPVNDHIEKWMLNQQKSSIKDPACMIFQEQFMRHFSGKVRIGFPVFEMEVLQPAAIQALANLDIILQPSEWGKEVLKNYKQLKNKPIHVVPEGFNPEVFFPDRTEEEQLKSMDKVRFIHIGKAEMRKSTIEVIYAFAGSAGEFEERETVLHLLVMDPFDESWSSWVADVLDKAGYNGIIAPDGKNIHYKKGKSTIIKYNGRMKDQHAIAKLMSKCHFGIWASKAEGWNLPLCEAIGCGLPSFTTGWTGQSEFVKNWPAALEFRTHRKQIADDKRWFRGDRGMWRMPDLDEMIIMIRDVLRHPEQTYIDARRDMIQRRKNLTWEKSAERFLAAMKKEGVKL